jgi:Uma2 family endonuclease
MTVALPDPTSPHAVRLTVRDFLLLSDNGAFDDYSKAELIEGEIVCVNAQFARHSRAKSRLAFALAAALREMRSSLEVYVEVAVEVDEHTLLEPDIVLSSYAGQGVVPVAGVALVVEVADTTLGYDLDRKSPRYAAAGIAENWVVDLAGGRLLQLWRPLGDGYAERREVALGEPAGAVTIADLEVPTALA